MMKEKYTRIAIVIGVLIVHFLVATKIRFLAYENHWNIVIQVLLGSIPSFYSVIGLTQLANLIEKTKQLRTPFIVGAACLAYEITGDFGRTSGSGTQVDIYDVAAIPLGVLIAYLLEKFYFEKRYSGINPDKQP